MWDNTLSYNGNQGVDFGRCEENYVENMYHGWDELQAVHMPAVMVRYLFCSFSTTHMYVILELISMQFFYNKQTPDFNKMWS